MWNTFYLWRGKWVPRKKYTLAIQASSRRPPHEHYSNNPVVGVGIAENQLNAAQKNADNQLYTAEHDQDNQLNAAQKIITNQLNATQNDQLNSTHQLNTAQKAAKKTVSTTDKNVRSERQGMYDQTSKIHISILFICI